MKPSFIFLIIVAALCFTTCKQQGKTVEESSIENDSVCEQNTIIEVDLSGSYPQKDLFLQDIAEVRYVPLETSEQSLLKSIRFVAMRDDKIIITDFSHQVLVFDSAGRYISKISRKGPGPSDYQSIAYTAVDFDKQLVYIEDVMGIKAYDFDGYLIKKLPKPDYTSASMLYVWDSERLIAYYETKGMKEAGDTLLGNYFFINTETGARTPVGINIPDPASNSVTEIRDGMYRSRIVPIYTMLKSDGKVVISDYIYPSVYEYSPNGLNLIIEKKYGDDMNCLSSVYLVSDKYIIFRTIKTSGHDKVENYKLEEVHDFIYNRLTDAITEGGIYNRDWESAGACFVEGWGNDLPKNTLVQSIRIDNLVELNEKGRLSGPLKALADTIDPDSNDILMIATLNSK